MRRCLGAIIGFCGLAYGSLVCWIALFHPHKAVDFEGIYRALTASMPYTLPSSQGIVASGSNLNPPLMMWLLSPLAGLDFSHALMVLSLFNFVCLSCLSVWVVNDSSVDVRQSDRPWLVLVLLSSYPVLTILVIGQVASIVALIIMFGFVCFRQQWLILAGIAWSLATALKFFPGLLLVWMVIGRHWRVVRAAILTLLMIHLTMVLWVPQYHMGDFLSSLSGVYWYGHSWNISLVSLPFTWLFNTHRDLAQFHHLKTTMFCLLIIGLVYYIYLIQRVKTAEAQFSLTLVFMGLLSPLFWIYFLPILWYALVYFWSIASRSALRIGVMAALLCLFIPQHNYFTTRDAVGRLAAVGQISLLTYSLLGLAVWTPRLSMDHRQIPPDRIYDFGMIAIIGLMVGFSWLSCLCFVLS